MRHASQYFPRHAARLIEEALADTRVVVVNGARQSGKSTLAEEVRKQQPAAVARFLDNPGTRAAAADPVGFLQHDGLMLIDEVQRVPDLWLAVKYLVDRDPRPGRFLLTGSARLLALRSLPDALPGRSETIELWPLSQGEIDGMPDGFVQAAFRHGAQLRAEAAGLGRRDYLARARRGGYPEAVHRDNDRRRARFFADMSRLAGAVGITVPTVRTWLRILETIFLIKLVPAWSANRTARATSTPKVMFLDSGLAGHLAPGAAPDTSSGRLIENAGEIIAIEVKSAETIRSEDFRGVRLLQRRLGARFRAGYVLYCGAESLSFGDGLVALPISALWTTPSA
ncbi:ATP-binding protein [Paractinoplanes rishiriensis]|uniref:ATP-binding protein n=1 Tax=Paractinoplanes rishiriensis TaxID=1050105 RepID=A0A919K5T9_9ACTN|nr:ATP-binding protein [Actinoplanes rishiriensis]GIF00155.1 hypothetical protein Ari01nite_76190 [Actinoplanes rishiriensis]